MRRAYGLATFILGGIHPPGYKESTFRLALESMPPVSRYIVSLVQHCGVPASSLVKKGDYVVEGQRIGSVNNGLGAHVHSPVSGTVVNITQTLHPIIGPVPAVAIERDPKAALVTWVSREWEQISSDDILAAIRDAGVVGMGGAGFPTHVKLSPPSGSSLDTLILNGAECESYLAADHRLMLERAPVVIQGARVLLAVLGVSRCIIGVEDNKRDAVQILRQAIFEASESGRITVEPLVVKYPQGSEKQLIEAITGRRVPAGGLPAHVGCVVQNVGTAFAIFEAVALKRPCYERVLTVAGKGIARPANLLCKVGVCLSDIAEYLGGITNEATKCVLGGPMMGLAVPELDVTVCKTTSGVLFLDSWESPDKDSGSCIRCGRCLNACPMGLSPNEMSIYAERGKYEGTQRFGLWECFECGSCAFVCPSKRPLVQFIRASKARLSGYKL